MSQCRSSTSLGLPDTGLRDMVTTSSLPCSFNWCRRRSRMKMGIVFFSCTAILPTLSTAAEALDRGRYDITQDYVSGDSLLDLVQDVLSDASRPLQPDRRERNTQSRFRNWVRNVLSSLSAVSHSSLVVNEKEEAKSGISPSQRQPHNRPLRISDTGDMFDSELHEGARLISASFGLIANTFGLVADGVRVSGDTAAGVIGSSVKLIGSAVKSISSNFDSAGSLLEPSEDTSERKKTLTSERLRERQRGQSDEEKFSVHQGGVLRNTRNVAGQSVKLIGSVIRGVGDTLLLAGEATETIAASTTGVAEDLVRIVEDFAGSLSFALSPNGDAKKRIKTKIKLDSIPHQQHGGDIPYLTFGSHAVPGADDEEVEYSSSSRRHKAHMSDMSAIATLEFGLRDIAEASGQFFEFLVKDTQGVPSFAAEILGVIIICFLAALWTLSSAARPPRRGSSLEAQNHIIHLTVTTNDDEPSLLSHESSDFHSFAGIAKSTSVADKSRQTKSHVSRSLWRLLVGFLLLPLKTFVFMLSMTRRVVLSRVTLLLVVYAGAWIYLCRASQIRSSAIQRNAEASGYRAAIDSIGSVSESVAWLNALLNKIWRVRYDLASEEGAQLDNLLKELYPKFVRRAIRGSTYGRFECRNCDPEGTGLIHDASTCLPFGGLEPYISGNIGSLLLDALGGSKASTRRGVAYASIYSFTLGKNPPLIRSVQLLKASQDGSKLHFNVDVDAILEDLSLVLEVKLSSLEYSLLPSTKVSIHAVDLTLPLEVSVSVRPDYPYISTVELSLSEAPECNVRITPLSGESGLRGVDVGSFPVIREWVKDVIRETLLEYVAPKFVAVDIAAWLTSAPVCPQTSIPTHAMADITQLRQKTRLLVNPNPRTASPGGIAITSVAETLPSHRSVSSAAFVQDDRKKEAAFTKRRDVNSLVKPTNQLSRLGMDRWIEKVRDDEIRERNSRIGLVGLLAKPLAVISPFLVAVAAGVFRDRVVKEEE